MYLLSVIDENILLICILKIHYFLPCYAVAGTDVYKAVKVCDNIKNLQKLKLEKSLVK